MIQDLAVGYITYYYDMTESSIRFGLMRTTKNRLTADLEEFFLVFLYCPVELNHRMINMKHQRL